MNKTTGTILLIIIVCLALFINLAHPHWYENEVKITSFENTSGYTLNIEEHHPSSNPSSSSWGQTFSPSADYNLTKVTFYLWKYGSPTVNLTAVLYLGESKPSGSSLVTSDPINSSTLTTSGIWYNFTFSASYIILTGTWYSIALQSGQEGIMDNIGNETRLGANTDSVSGNDFYYSNNQWTQFTSDLNFMVFGKQRLQVGLIEGNIAANTTSALAIRWQEKMVYSHGRYWLFFITGTGDNFVQHTSSIDAITWETPTNLTYQGQEVHVYEHTGENLQVLSDVDGKIHLFIRIAYVNATASGFFNLGYRCGLPSSNGSITWTDFQDIWTQPWYLDHGYGGTVDFFAVLDSFGYPWVSWGFVPSSGILDTDIWITKSDLKNGTWNTATGYPQEVYHHGTIPNYPMTNDFLATLSNGKIYLMYFASGYSGIYGQLWSGTTWGNIETATSYAIYDQFPYAHESWSRSCVTDDVDNIYLLFLSTEGYIIYVKRSTSSGWINETILENDAENYSSPSLTKFEPYDQLWAIWIDDPYNITGRRMRVSTGIWDNETYLIVSDTDGFPINVDTNAGYDGRLNSFCPIFNNLVGILWIANSIEEGVFNIKFGLLSPPAGTIYLTFYQDSNSILNVNGTTKENGNMTAYAYGTILLLEGSDFTKYYTFGNFTFPLGYSFSNPYLLTVDCDGDVRLYAKWDPWSYPPDFPSTPPALQYLIVGDYLGFINSVFTSVMGEMFYAFIMLVCYVGLYLRLKSIVIPLIAWTLMGGFWIGMAPSVTPFVALFWIIGIGGGVLFSVFSRGSEN
jgi:hypothetical protein